MSEIHIKIADLIDLDLTIEHDLRHMTEPGFNNLPAHPFLKTHFFDHKDFLENERRKWTTPIKETGWGRSFIAISNEKVVGHLNIKNYLETALHRVKLGMGIEQAFRHNGIGSQLLKEAIKLCHENKIEYIDLSVFAHNIPAIKLYQKFGFTQTAVFHDVFRMDDVSIDDIQMVLKL